VGEVVEGSPKKGDLVGVISWDLFGEINLKKKRKEEINLKKRVIW
jgi:hypothetical protein